LLEFRCKDCGRLLGYVSGKAEIKCPKCHSLNHTPIEAVSAKPSDIPEANKQTRGRKK